MRNVKGENMETDNKIDIQDYNGRLCIFHREEASQILAYLVSLNISHSKATTILNETKHLMDGLVVQPPFGP